MRMRNALQLSVFLTHMFCTCMSGNGDIAVAARGGMETLKPTLQRLYMTRASAYKDALKSFIDGYQEGIQQTMEEKSQSKENDDDSKKSA